MKYTNIEVQVAPTQEANSLGQNYDARPCDTVKEAKAFAKYALTVEYQQSAELSEPMGYSCVTAFDGTARVCLYDYFRKE